MGDVGSRRNLHMVGQVAACCLRMRRSNKPGVHACEPPPPLPLQAGSDVNCDGGSKEACDTSKLGGAIAFKSCIGKGELVLSCGRRRGTVPLGQRMGQVAPLPGISDLALRGPIA